ncbi:MAG TPA: hypothetical protein VKE69_15045, partial [Planctomycetota bacterium]|nr:hypothetical protein [Planctomycetota bacterium]
RIVATDNAAHVLTVPPGDDAFRFAVGLRTTLFSDKLDTGAAGWTHTQVTQQDDWNLGDPQTLGTNGFDPATPFSGTACWGNDLQITSTSQNGLYQPNVDNYLESPNINASGHTGVRVRFRRWLTVESGQFDQARVFANGVQIWSNPQLTDLLDSTWTLQDVAATPANGAAAFKVRWRLTSDGGVEYGGWTIDDVEVYALEPTPVLTLNVTPSSTTPTVGTTLSFDLNGTSNAAWALFLSAGPGPSTVPGIGVALIDGSTLVQLDGGLLDPAGHAGSALPIPGIAGLVGLKLYWIGVVDTAAGLPQISNAFATTFQ